MRIRSVGAVLLGALSLAATVDQAIVAGQPDSKAADVLAATRKAIGGRKIEALKSLSVDAAMQRNVGNFQMNSDLELLVELPDKYMRSEVSAGGAVGMSNAMGFNGERPLKSPTPAGVAPGGGMIIRMGGPAGAPLAAGEKPTPEQQQQIDRQMVRAARLEIGRLMLGWLGMAHPSLNAQYTYAGEAESPDGRAHVIDVRNDDGFAARLFIDTKTQLPLMVTYQGPQPRMVTAGAPRAAGDARPQGPPRQLTDEERKALAADAQRQLREMQTQPPPTVEFTLFFDDWRDEDGIKFPHAVRRATAGTTTEEWTVKKVRVNPRIDPKKFETQS